MAQRIVFGVGALEGLARECDALGLHRLAVLTGSHHRTLGERCREGLGAAGVALYSGAVEHTPVEVTEEGAARIAPKEVDGLVAIGGGAAIGLGKALAARRGLLLVAVPTTFSGSEMTAVVGERRDGVKSTRRDERVLPRTVIYDPALAATMPAALAATSGMNALAHAFGAIAAPDASPFSDGDALQAIDRLVAGLPGAVRGEEGCEEALLGAAFAGRCLSATTMGLQHRLSHLLGGSCALPHSPTHAVLLPHTVAEQVARQPARFAAAAPLLGCHSPAEIPEALFALQETLGAPRSLAELGLHDEAIHTVALAAGGGDAARAVEIGALLARASVGR